MFGFFGIKRIFAKVFILILSIYIVDMALYLTLGNITQGIVIIYRHLGTNVQGNSTIRYPVIRFEANNKTYKFNGNWEAPYSYGDTVKVVYWPWFPSKVKVFSFWGMAKKSVLQVVVCTLIWFMVYSSFKPSANKAKRKPKVHFRYQ